jgi:hypothetical protein
MRSMSCRSGDETALAYVSFLAWSLVQVSRFFEGLTGQNYVGFRASFGQT